MSNLPVQFLQTKRLALVVLGVVGCAALALATWVTSPVLASILNTPSAPSHPPFARMTIPKPSANEQPETQPLAVLPTLLAAQEQPVILPTPTAFQSAPPDVAVIPATIAPTAEAFIFPTDAPTLLPEVASAPEVIVAEIVADTPTPEYVTPTAAPNAPPQVAGNSGRWIDVNLSQQRVYAYEGDALMNSFIVSTGTWQTPTVTGQYNIWIKLRSTTMSGPGYYLTNVPYVMYFHGGYGLHGTYWHNNFGTPMSHGCVNLSTFDAEWLYNFASVGTLVNVHY